MSLLQKNTPTAASIMKASPEIREILHEKENAWLKQLAEDLNRYITGNP